MSITMSDGVQKAAARLAAGSDPTALLVQACRYGPDDVVDFLMSTGKRMDLDVGICEAAIHGRQSIVRTLISIGCNAYGAFSNACTYGHEPIVRMLIPRFVGQLLILDNVFPGACRSGSESIVRLLISYGAGQSVDVWNAGLQHAALNGNESIVRLLISVCVDGMACDWNYGLRNACLYGHLPVVRLIICSGGNDWNGGLKQAYIGKNNQIIGLLLRNGATNAADVFELPRDWKLIFDLLTTTDAPRCRLAAVPNVYKFVLRRLDNKRKNLTAAMNDNGWPTVLQQIVLDYCVNR